MRNFGSILNRNPHPPFPEFSELRGVRVSLHFQFFTVFPNRSFQFPSMRPGRNETGIETTGEKRRRESKRESKRPGRNEGGNRNGNRNDRGETKRESKRESRTKTGIENRNGNRNGNRETKTGIENDRGESKRESKTTGENRRRESGIESFPHFSTPPTTFAPLHFCKFTCPLKQQLCNALPVERPTNAL